MIKTLYTFWVIMLLLQTTASSRSNIAQSDTNIVQYQYTQDTIVKRHYSKLDSATIARRKVIKDSLKAIGDSLSYIYIKAPNPNRPNLFLDSLIKLYTVEKLNFTAWAKKFSKKTSRYNEGKLQPRGEKWVIAVLIFLIVIFGILKEAFSKELTVIMESFYSNRILSQINKEDSLFGSWPFIFLYLLFGLTMGMLLYLLSKYLDVGHSSSGFEWFLILSIAVIGFFSLKIIVLRLLGFFFGIEKLVKSYISILYLSYFNVAIIFLPLIVAFSLLPYRYSEILGYAAIIILILIFVFQFVRAAVNILSAHQFPKVYLFLYLCALEICPLLILIKALRFEA